MDYSTIVGVLSGLILFSGAIIMGGNAVVFFSLQSLMIVLGGIIAGTMISFSFTDLLKIPSLLKISAREEQLNSDKVIEVIVKLAQRARREGLLALEQELEDINNSFLQEGVELIIDGSDPELVKNILTTRLFYLEERHKQGRSIFATMGQMSPAFGMIGTLIGLIRMLSQLDSPETLGSGMAVALITTLYGTLLANLFFIPISKKLRLRTEKEVLLKEIIIEGILSIQSGENPRIIREKLKSYLNKQIGEEEKRKLRTSVVGENA